MISTQEEKRIVSLRPVSFEKQRQGVHLAQVFLVVRVNFINACSHHQSKVYSIIEVNVLCGHIVRTHKQIVLAEINDFESSVRHYLLECRLYVSLPTHS